jgi:O-antigen ligase
MKKVFYINDSTENKISYYHLLFFLLALPFDRIYSTLILISFVIHSIIFLDKSKFKKIDTSTLVPQFVFYITVISAIYSQSASESLATISRQLALFIFPILFAITSLDLAKYRDRIMDALAATCALIVIYLYYDALHSIHYYRLPLKDLFSLAFVNQNFSEPLDMHPTYLSMLIVLSIVQSLTKIISKSEKSTYYIVINLILFAGLVQLSSKSAFLSLLVIVIAGIPFLIIKPEKRFKFVLSSFIASLLLISCMLSVQAFKNRYITTLKNDLVESREVVNMNGRLDRWAVAINLIKQSPVIGTGSGSEIPLLKDAYFKLKMYGPYLFSLNAHNQYLSFLITSGIVGLIVYLTALSWGLWQSVKTRDILLFSFIMVIMIVSFSEDLLDVNKGFFFFAFFYPFFLKTRQSLKHNFIK